MLRTWSTATCTARHNDRTEQSTDGFREGMRGAVHIGVLVLVEVGHAVNDGLGLLRRGRIVEPHQRTPIYLLLQDGEILAEQPRFEWTLGKYHNGDNLRVELGGLDGGGDDVSGVRAARTEVPTG